MGTDIDCCRRPQGLGKKDLKTYKAPLKKKVSFKTPTFDTINDFGTYRPKKNHFTENSNNRTGNSSSYLDSVYSNKNELTSDNKFKNFSQFNIEPISEPAFSQPTTFPEIQAQQNISQPQYENGQNGQQYIMKTQQKEVYSPTNQFMEPKHIKQYVQPPQYQNQQFSHQYNQQELNNYVKVLPTKYIISQPEEYNNTTHTQNINSQNIDQIQYVKKTITYVQPPPVHQIKYVETPKTHYYESSLTQNSQNITLKPLQYIEIQPGTSTPYEAQPDYIESETQPNTQIFKPQTRYIQVPNTKYIEASTTQNIESQPDILQTKYIEVKKPEKQIQYIEVQKPEKQIQYIEVQKPEKQIQYIDAQVQPTTYNETRQQVYEESQPIQYISKPKKIIYVSNPKQYIKTEQYKEAQYQSQQKQYSQPQEENLPDLQQEPEQFDLTETQTEPQQYINDGPHDSKSGIKVLPPKYLKTKTKSVKYIIEEEEEEERDEDSSYNEVRKKKKNKKKTEESFSPDGYKKFYPSDDPFFKRPKGKKSYKIYNEDDGSNKEVYEGEMMNGKKHGIGKLTTKDYIREGTWKEDKFTGWGRESKPNGEVLEGRFVDGKVEGKGILRDSKGSSYIGDFVDSKREGFGELDTKKANYKGQFKNNKFNGHGKINIKDDGSEIEGEFRNGEIENERAKIFRDGKIIKAASIEKEKETQSCKVPEFISNIFCKFFD